MEYFLQLFNCCHIMRTLRVLAFSIDWKIFKGNNNENEIMKYVLLKIYDMLDMFFSLSCLNNKLISKDFALNFQMKP